MAMGQSRFPLAFREAVSLAPYTTLGIGGAARFFAEAETEPQVREALEFAEARGLPLFILGGGSNLVVSDAGFNGLVVRIAMRGIKHGRDGVVTAAAGEEWDSFVHHCVALNLAGVECLSGIPGSVGGTPVQNVGAYGREAGDVIVGVRVLDRSTMRVSALAPEECGFAYRTSIFNSSQRERYVVLAVTFALWPGGRSKITYPELLRHFGERQDPPTLIEMREAVMNIRRSKSMIIRPDDPDSKSAGSFFKNPFVPRAVALKAEEAARHRNTLKREEIMPQYPAPDGTVKLSAAWLIEHSGFAKGYSCGRVGISGHHALALINRGGATAKELMDLMRGIQDAVQAAFGVGLTPEPVFVGFDS